MGAGPTAVMIGSRMAEVDDLALPPARSRGDSAIIVADDAAIAADAVGEAERRQGRRPVGRAGHRGEPAHRLGQGAEAGPLRVRPVLAEAGDPHDDQARIDLV